MTILQNIKLISSKPGCLIPLTRNIKSDIDISWFLRYMIETNHIMGCFACFVCHISRNCQQCKSVRKIPANMIPWVSFKIFRLINSISGCNDLTFFLPLTWALCVHLKRLVVPRKATALLVVSPWFTRRFLITDILVLEVYLKILHLLFSGRPTNYLPNLTPSKQSHFLFNNDFEFWISLTAAYRLFDRVPNMTGSDQINYPKLLQ